jgi:site-specific recombinase XerD
LYNFDDSLIVKVTKVKYKTKANFLLMNDIKQHDVKTVVKDVPEAVQEERETLNTEKIFYIRKTNAPDIYELYEDASSMQIHSYASVNTLQTSKSMHNHFIHANVCEKKPFKCQYSEKFKKWVPIHIVEYQK